MQLFERKLFRNLKEQLIRKEYAIIVGARQTGKTTLLNQLYNFLSDEKKKVYQLSLEDPRILSSLNKHPEELLNFISFPADEKIYLLIDEVQYLDNPSNFLKLLYDKYVDKIKIIATGSSAFYIDRKFSDSLAGRKQLYELYTLDFEEFLDFKTSDHFLIQELFEIRKNPEYISSRRNEIKSLFDEYLTYGGYPSVVLEDDRKQKIVKLKELFTSFLKRDVLEAGIEYQDKFFNLFNILAHQTGSLMNINELSSTLKLSVTAVENYTYILRKCFHIHLVRPFFKNIRKEITKMPKIYFNDLGLRNVLLNQFMPVDQRLDRGALVENYVFIRLRQIYDKDQIRFWRTADGNEIDFVITISQDNGYAIEAKFNESEFRSKKYRNFNEHYPNYPLECRAYHSDSNVNNIIGM